MDSPPRKPQSGRKTHLAAQLFERSEDAPQDEWRRSDARRELWELVDIEVERRVIKASARNVSPDSLGVICKKRIAIYANVRVRLASGGEWSDAQVAHCTETVGGFKVGLKFE